jgi:hypothetical protein
VHPAPYPRVVAVFARLLDACVGTVGLSCGREDERLDAVLEGSVQRTGNRVRVTVQWIHVPTDAHLWSREYDRDLTDVLNLPRDVARAVAEEVQVRLTAEERARLASADSVNPAAYQEYLLGQHYLWRLDEENLARAIGHFEQSARLNPRYAPAYAGLSHAWWWRGIWGAVPFKQVESPSRTAALKAVELDPGLPRSVAVGGPHQVWPRVGLDRREAGVHTRSGDRPQQRRRALLFGDVVHGDRLPGRVDRPHEANRGARSALGNRSVSWAA